jgi:hypothetical protein
MKKCTYCGKEYPDDATVCSVDEQPLTFVGPPQTKIPPTITPAGKEQESCSPATGDALVAQDLTPRNLAQYKIIGADQMEYGPVSAEQIRLWVTERRVDSETKLQAEGGGEWKRVADVPELAAALKGNSPPCCPKCGEPFEDGLDSCWKCGTKQDGSPPAKEWTPVEDVANGVATPVEEVTNGVAGQCPRCQSQRVAVGRLASDGAVVFLPGTLRSFTLTVFGGVPPSNPHFRGCLDCGFLWGQIDQAKLEAFIRKHCTEETRRECGVSDDGT